MLITSRAPSSEGKFSAGMLEGLPAFGGIGHGFGYCGPEVLGVVGVE